MEERKGFDKTIERPPSRYMKQMKVTNPEEKQKISYSQDSGLYQLQLFNMITSEGAFAATMQMEIQKILDEIKSLDIDSAIRLGKPNELSKVYIKELKKWLFSVQSLNKEAIDKKINSQTDVQQVLDAINVKDPQEGVKKLFKILQVLEIMITKISELEAVTFLKYDDHIQGMKEGNKINLKSKISALAQGQFFKLKGISLSKFSIMQANQERYIELCDIISRSQGIQKKPVDLPLDQINSTEDLLNYLKRMTNSEANSNFIHQHISLMVKKEKQMNEIIREQESQISQFKRDQKNTSNQNPAQQIVQNQNQTDQKYYLKIIDKMESDYNEERRNDKEIILNLREKLDEIKLELQESQNENKLYEEQLIKSKQETQQVQDKFAAKFKDKNDMEDSYENALKEQMENLRVGFLTQIANQQEQIREMNRKKQREIDDLKTQLKKEQENKRLLLRKLEIIQPI